ncbi:unnamed protein product [Camellia sinensis]
MKKPWEITGPCAHPEYKDAVPKATEYRFFCPTIVPVKAIIPTSDPEMSTTSSISLAISAEPPSDSTNSLEEI